MTHIDSVAKGLRSKAGVYAQRAQSFQLPITAHTSGNAKVAIGASLVLSTLALATVVGYLSHRLARRTSKTYQDKTDKVVTKGIREAKDSARDIRSLVESSVNDALGKSKDVSEDAKKVVTDVVEDAKDKVGDVSQKVERTSKPAAK